MRTRSVFALAASCAVLLAGCGAPTASAPHHAVQKAPAAAHAGTTRLAGVPSGPPHPGVQGAVAVTLPVTQIPTTFAVEQTRTIPESVTVTIPAAWQGAVGAYWSGVVLLGPAGWHGIGMFGADGSGGVTLYPPGVKLPSNRPYYGPQITVTTAGGCLGCGDESAAAFFPYVRQHWSQFRIIDGPAPKPAPVLSQVALAPDVVAYRLPNTKSGLEVNGVAYSGLAGAPHYGPPFEQMNATLPAGDHALATVVLNYFLHHDLPNLP